MFIRYFWLGVAGALFLAVGEGCSKSSSPDASPAPQKPAVSSDPVPAGTSNVIARLHWLGKKQLAAEKNAAHLMTIWNLPESIRLETQTLDKLSLGLFGFPNGTEPPPGRTNPISLSAQIATNQLASKLRPLLDDILQQESYVEVRSAGSGARNGEIAFAIRIDPNRATLWQNNLAALREQGTWVQQINVARAVDWTLVGYSASGGTNGLLADFAARIQHDHKPFASGPANSWIEAKVDPCRFAAAFVLGCQLPEMVPNVNLSVTGDGSNVVSRGQLTFPKPLPFQIEPWNIPTNLIYGPLHSVAAIQGFRTWLAGCRAWKELGISTPNQAFFWAEQPAPFLTYSAFPEPDCTNAAARIADLLVTEGNPWLSNNAWGEFQKSPVGDGVKCTAGSPLFAAFLRAETKPEGEFLLSGFNPIMSTGEGPPDWLARDLLTHTNLVLYEREATGARVGSWLYLGQALRLLFYGSQLPFTSASLDWIKSSAGLLGFCKTMCVRSAPNELSFERDSGVGLNSIELHLLAEWLESPAFPRSLHVLLAPRLARPGSSGKSTSESFPHR